MYRNLSCSHNIFFSIRPSFEVDASVSDPPEAQLAARQLSRTIKQPRELVSNLKAFEGLKPQSQVAPPIVTTKQKHGKTDFEKLVRKLKQPLVGKHPPTKVVKKKERSLTGRVFNDLWADEDKKDEISKLKEEQEYRLNPRTRPPPRVFNKPNLVPAIDLPHSGSSYNPSKHHYEQLAKKIVKKEKEKALKDAKLQDEEASKKKCVATVDQQFMEEMSQGLDDDDEGFDDQEDEDMEKKETTKNSATTSDGRKSTRQRNKEKKAKILRIKSAQKKVAKQKASRELGIKKLLRQLKEEEVKTQARVKVREARLKRQILEGKEGKKFVTGKGEIPWKEEVIALPSDLKGNLRSVKMEGNLLKDRFNSLIRRSLIEPRVKATAKSRETNKKSSLKSYKKRSHREPGEDD